MENRVEFVNNFDYTLFDDYIFLRNEYVNTAFNPPTHYFKYYSDFFKIINEKYNIPFKEQHTFPVIQGGYVHSDDSHKNKYFKNILRLEFCGYYPNLFTSYYLENKINYNEESFLLYALLTKYRAYVKKNIPILNEISKLLVNIYFAYLAKNQYICENYAHEYTKNLCQKLENFCFYADTDCFFFKDISVQDLENLISNLDVKFDYEITPIKYFYYERVRTYSFYYKDLNNQYQIAHKGSWRNGTNKKIIEKNFLKDLRLEKIEKLLKT